MLNTRWILLGFAVVGLALAGCNITMPDLNFGSSQGVVADEANAHVTVEFRWIRPRGTDGYRAPTIIDLSPRGHPGLCFYTPSLAEGEYKVIITETATGNIVKQGRIFIPANDGNRDFAYEEVPGAHPPMITMFHWGVVVTGTHPHYAGTRISS